MGFTDLFKSSKEIEREKNRARRKAMRKAEKAGDVVKDRIEELRKSRDTAWMQAREYLRDGQKAAAQRCLLSVQKYELEMGRQERKSWVYSQKVTRMEAAKTDQEFATALAELNATLEIDPEKVGEVLDDVADTLSEQDDIDKLWEKEYEKEMKGLSQSDAIPSIAEMMGNLEKEVAADVRGGKSVTANVSSAGKDAVGGIAEKIGEGRRRLKELLDGKK